MPDHWRLELEGGAALAKRGRPHLIEFGPTTTLVGRSVAAAAGSLACTLGDLEEAPDLLSRQHLRIEMGVDGPVLTDTSFNGTTVEATDGTATHLARGASMLEAAAAAHAAVRP